MANNSFYSPMDIANPSFTPPIDKSSLYEAKTYEGIAETGKNMLDLFGKYKKGVAMDEVESDYTKAISDYENQSPSFQGLLKKNIARLEGELDSAKNDTTQPVGSIDLQIKRITSDLNDARTRLTKARDQGTITPLELETRLDQITREKVASNPAFRNEIISHAAQTKDMLGISQIMTRDTAFYNEIAQAEKEARTRMYQDVNTYHINLNDPKFKNLDGSTNANAVNVEINDRRGKVGIYDGLNNLFQIKDIQQKIRKEDIIGNNLPAKYLEGSILKTQAELSSIWDNPQLDINQKMQAATNFITSQKLMMSSWMSGFNNDKDISYIKDDYTNLTNSLQENFKNIKSGKEMKEFLENQLGIITAKQNIGLNNVVNTTQMKFIADVVGKLGNNAPETLKAQLNKDLILLTDAFATSNTTGILNVSPEVRTRMFDRPINPNNPERKQADLLLDSAINSVLITDPTTLLFKDSVTNYENVLKLYSAHSNEVVNNPKQSLYVSDKVMQSLGDSRVRSKGIQFSDGFKSDIDQNIAAYANKINTEIANLKGKPDGVILGSNPDGTLIARKDPSLKVTNEALQQNYVNRFNSIIVSRINNSMKAYATVHNTTTQAVSADFIRQYYGPMFSNLATGNQKPTESTFTPSENQKKANAIIGIPDGQ